MKIILLFFFFGALTVAAQMNPIDQAIADRQLADKNNEAQNLIMKQQLEARQKGLDLQKQVQALQAQQGTPQPGNQSAPEGNPSQPQSTDSKPQTDSQAVGDIKIPTGPVKAGQFTQQSVGVNNSKELEQRVAGRIKDPFMLPNHLYIKIKRKLGDIQGEGYIDESVEPQRRWALKRYKLVAIIWNVKRPKAMITDVNQELHMFYVNDKIGNSEGVITGISNGEVTVNEKGTESRLKMIK